MLAKYNANQASGIPSQYYPGSLVQSQLRPSPYSGSGIIVTPNVRAAGIASRQQGPVQIYNLPGVVAPGIVGRFSQIGY